MKKPNKYEVDEACMNYRHDFGLMSSTDANALRFQAMEWFQAWEKVNEQKESDALTAEVAALKAENERLRGTLAIDARASLKGGK